MGMVGTLLALEASSLSGGCEDAGNATTVLTDLRVLEYRDGDKQNGVKKRKK